MTGQTHDLAAFTALSYVAVTQPLNKMTLATALVALGANLIGGLTPDIDQPTAALWNRIPAGPVISRIFAPILGGHRFISHSLIGVAVFGIGTHYLFKIINTVLLVDMHVVWWAFMIGFVSHLVIDMLTREGTVDKITLRLTVLKDKDENTIYIPNSQVANVVRYKRETKQLRSMLPIISRTMRLCSVVILILLRLTDPDGL